MVYLFLFGKNANDFILVLVRFPDRLFGSQGPRPDSSDLPSFTTRPVSKHIGSVGKFQPELDILLHQHDADISLIVSLLQRAMIRSTTIGARPKESSSTRRSFGLAMSPRPIAHICCSPPLRVPASWSFLSASLGRRLEDHIQIAFHICLILSCKGPKPQVLTHGKPGKEKTTFGNMSNTQSDPLSNGRPGDILFQKPDPHLSPG